MGSISTYVRTYGPEIENSIMFFSLLYLSVANGEPPIGIPWETFRKYIREKYKGYYERMGEIQY